MATTFTLNKLTAGKMTITKSGSNPPEVSIEYLMTTQTDQFPSSRVFPYTPTAGEVTTLNAFIAKIIDLIKVAEGIP